MMASFHYAIYLFAGKHFCTCAKVGNSRAPHQFKNTPRGEIIAPRDALVKAFGSEKQVGVVFGSYSACLPMEETFGRINEMIREGEIVVEE